jgi:hypothetical protein
LGKVFAIDSSGLKLHLANSRSLVAACISSDGKVFAASALLDCAGPQAGCTGAVFRRTTITVGGQDQDYFGDLRLSAGRKFAFGIGSLLPSPLFTAYLVNVTTGESTVF